MEYNLEKRKYILDLAILRGWKYNDITGEILSSKNKIPTFDKNGYYFGTISIEKKSYGFRCHQLAYYIYHKKLANIIDHIDGNTKNNKIENLRSVTHQENCFNRVRSKGYSWNKKEKKFKAKIKVNNIAYHLGYFDNEQDARNAYLNAKEKYHLIN